MNNNFISWQQVLMPLLNQEQIQQRQALVDLINPTLECYPPQELIYYAFKTVSPLQVKVVILGQDPYHQPHQAHGLAFSTLDDRLPKSLINIFKELKNDLNIKRTNGNLTDWANQGVLLLNTILTVSRGLPLSHQTVGYEEITLKVIKYLNDNVKNVVYVLWGNFAKKYQPYITNPNHLVLCSVHPSPLSANKGFFNSKPFSKINQYLTNNNLVPIKW